MTVRDQTNRMTEKTDSFPKELPAESASSGVELHEAESANPFLTWPYVDRRGSADRRNRPTSLWESFVRRGRRARGRRSGEDSNIYVDVYGRREILLILLILILNILDAYFTLDYLEKGGSEANPIAQGLLDLGDSYFAYAKSLVVGICLVFLLVHKKFSFVKAALTFLTVFYTVLLAYHIFLQVRYYLGHA